VSATARPARSLRAPAPASAPSARKPRAPLAVAPARVPRASSGTFALVVGGVLTLGLLGLLGLNTLLAQGSFAAHELAQQQAQLTVREQALQQEVAVLQSPQELARRALELGMVGSENPVFLDLRTGKILGAAKPGVRPPAVAKAAPATPTAPTAPTTQAPTKPAPTKPAPTKPGTAKR
jgi:hypothetical protein